MKVDQEEVKDFVEKKGRKYVIDNVITRCPTNCLSLNDDDTLEVDNRNCVKCMHCLNVMPKALSPGDDKGATILMGGKRTLKVGDLMGTVIVPFMKLETEEDYEKLTELAEETIDFWAENGLEHERCGEMIERIGLVNFLDGIGVDVDPNMVADPTTSSYVRMDGWDDEAEKYAHFVDLCDAFNMPVMIFLDMPGFMLGSHAERKATMRRGISALIASYEADVPKIEFNIRKSYGVAADAPNSLGQPNGVNLRYGWPAGEYGGIPIEGGVAAAYRREIENAPDPEAHRTMIEERLLKLRSPFRAAFHGDMVDLIDPRETRYLACKFVKLAQPVLKKLAQRPKRTVRP